MEIRSEGVSLGYVVLDAPGVGDVGRVVEYAGSRVAIASSFSMLINSLNLSGIGVTIPSWDAEFLNLLSRSGVSVPKSTPPILTMKVMNLHGLLEKLQPYLEERLDKNVLGRMRIERVSGGYLFSLDGERLRISERDITWLLFDMPEIVEGPGQRFLRRKPLTVEEGSLKEVLSRIFPLPIITYGMMAV